MTHGPWPFSRIVVRRSKTGGYTSQAKQMITEKVVEKKEGALNCLNAYPRRSSNRAFQGSLA